MTIGDKIYELRTRNNMSQGDLANELGVSRQSVSKWETGQSIPDVDRIVNISKIFDVTVDYLVNNNDDIEKQSKTEFVQGNKLLEKPILNRAKYYYYNETLTKIICFIILLIFVPINIFIYNKGVYGEIDLDIVFLGKMFLKDSMYDIVWIIMIIGSLIKFIKDIKTGEKTKVLITKKDRVISIITFYLIAIPMIIVYFKFPLYTPIVAFSGMFGLVFIATFEAIREITKKRYEVDYEI